MNKQNNGKTSKELLEERMSSGFPGGVDRASTNIQMTEVPMTVTIDELRPSLVLPRLKRNELYEDIKSSIREKGLDHPPVISKTPGQGGYVISDGGNTRLAILKELYEETGNSKFYTIKCLFRPWRGELKSLIGHLTENGLRDDYTFIEKAIGIAKSKALYEEETGKSLSIRELSSRLKEDGYPISISLISKMLNTMEYLYPSIPTILNNGLGKPQIDKLLTLRTLCLDLYHRSGKFEDDTAFNEGFDLVLSGFELDPELYNYDILQDEMFGYFGKILDVKYNVFEFSLQEKSQKGKIITPIDVTHNNNKAVEQPSEAHFNHEATTKTTTSVNSTPDKLQNNEVSTKSQSKPKDMSQHDTIDDNNDRADNKPYTISGNGQIVMNKGENFQDVVKTFAENEDFSESFPHDFSLTLRLNTFEGNEKKPIVDIWKLPKQMTTHEYVFSDIAGHVLDILKEMRMDEQTMAPFSINRESRETYIGFNAISEHDKSDPLKHSMYTMLKALLTDDDGQININFSYLTKDFNDFVIIKLLRIIRLKRVYDELMKEYLEQK